MNRRLMPLISLALGCLVVAGAPAGFADEATCKLRATKSEPVAAAKVGVSARPAGATDAQVVGELIDIVATTDYSVTLAVVLGVLDEMRVRDGRFIPTLIRADEKVVAFYEDLAEESANRLCGRAIIEVGEHIIENAQLPDRHRPAITGGTAHRAMTR